MVKILMSLYQLESGLDEPFEKNITELVVRCLTPSLVLSLVCALQELNVELKVPHWVSKGGNRTIMRFIIDRGLSTETL